MSGIGRGSRVYWHGVFPDTAKRATVKRPGTMNHEVTWDGSDRVTLVQVGALAKIVRGRPVCPYKPACGYCQPV